MKKKCGIYLSSTPSNKGGCGVGLGPTVTTDLINIIVFDAAAATQMVLWQYLWDTIF